MSPTASLLSYQIALHQARNGTAHLWEHCLTRQPLLEPIPTALGILLIIVRTQTQYPLEPLEQRLLNSPKPTARQSYYAETTQILCLLQIRQQEGILIESDSVRCSVLCLLSTRFLNLGWPQERRRLMKEQPFIITSKQNIRGLHE